MGRWGDGEMGMPIPPILVLGYGNTLRSDDGVGYRVAAAVHSWHLPDVEGYPCHQLTPDLAAEIAPRQRVIFVDARVADAGDAGQIQWQLVQPVAATDAPISTHAATPAALMALARSLYHSQAIAHQLTIPAVNFAFGETLSAVTTQAEQQALRSIRELCSQPCGRTGEPGGEGVGGPEGEPLT
jgi:hydrogenase maturation protease